MQQIRCFRVGGGLILARETMLGKYSESSYPTSKVPICHVAPAVLDFEAAHAEQGYGERERVCEFQHLRHHDLPTD